MPKISSIRTAILIRYRRVTDRQTDRHTYTAQPVANTRNLPDHYGNLHAI